MERIDKIEGICSGLKGGGQLASAECLEAASPSQRINAAMIAELNRTRSADIVNELQRRLGVANLEETGVPLSMMDEDLQDRVRSAEAFHTLGVPEPFDPTVREAR